MSPMFILIDNVLSLVRPKALLLLVHSNHCIGDANVITVKPHVFKLRGKRSDGSLDSTTDVRTIAVIIQEYITGRLLF